MEYAIIRLGGRQYTIEKGTKITLERLGTSVPEVLMYSSSNGVLIGNPVLSDYSVDFEILDEKKARKVRVARFKAKSRYRKANGHRQPISIIEIKDIIKGKVKSTKKEVKEEKPVEIKKEEKQIESEAPKKRGRPAKAVEQVEEAPKKRGRPKKS